MGYLSDYIYFNSGSECPRDFYIWSALSLLGHIVGKKVWFNHGFVSIEPQLYVGLFGSAGSGKSTAKNVNQRIIVNEFPQLLVSASVQSREDIIDLMLEDSGRTWQHPETKEFHDFRPFYIIANEFEAFLSVNPQFMVQFLVDIFDTGYYSKGFKKDRGTGKSHSMVNPYVSVLSCGIPEWLMRELKVSMFSGGLGRRMVIVIAERDKLVPRPYRPPDWKAAYSRVIAHLNAAYFLAGEMKETSQAKRWWEEWYLRSRAKAPLDPMLAQFWSTEHVILQKVAMLLALDERPFRMTIEAEHYEVGLAMLENLKPRIHQLTSGVGRNQVAGFSSELLETLRSGGGWLQEMRLRLLTYRNAPGGMRGYEEAVKHLADTGQIVQLVPSKPDAAGKYMPQVWLPEVWKAFNETPQPTKENEDTSSV